MTEEKERYRNYNLSGIQKYKRLKRIYRLNRQFEYNYRENDKIMDEQQVDDYIQSLKDNSKDDPKIGELLIKWMDVKRKNARLNVDDNEISLVKLKVVKPDEKDKE